MNLINYLIQRTFKPENELIKVSIPGYLSPVYLRNNQSDIQIFTQIFLREELDITLNVLPATIIDGGANIGLASRYLKNKYPGATIYSIEPDKSNFSLLLKNTSLYKNIICYNNGIWNKNATLKIINKDAGNESFIVNETEVNENHLETSTLKALTINEIVKINRIKNIDLLKLDIEGSERKVFENNYLEWLSITENILVEIHNWIDSKSEEVVTNVLKENFNNTMAGEYHYFKRKSSLIN